MFPETSLGNPLQLAEHTSLQPSYTGSSVLSGVFGKDERHCKATHGCHIFLKGLKHLVDRKLKDPRHPSAYHPQLGCVRATLQLR